MFNTDEVYCHGNIRVSVPSTSFKAMYVILKACKKMESEPLHDETNLIESSLCTQWVAKDPSFLHADSEDSNQTGQMPRLSAQADHCAIMCI